MTRVKKLLYTSITGIIYQITVVICGLILPNLIIRTFGSSVNGLISSINQFLNFIMLLEMGMYAVVTASLYKPLNDCDYDQISRIFVSSNRFFTKIGACFILYILVICIVYPLYFQDEYNFFYVCSLIIILSISVLSEYLIGISYSIILKADQMTSIVNVLRCITLIISTVIAVVLVNKGYGIHIVKICSLIPFVIRPFVVRYYVINKYNINRKVRVFGEPIKQKWNGVAQHIAFYVTTSTDAVVLTIFSSLSNVSIYSVYTLALNGILGLISAITSGIPAFLGNLFVSGNAEESKKSFYIIEWTSHFIISYIYTCTAILLVPFVKVYTNGITDANYYEPIFALIITAAYALRSLRDPYNSVVIGAGHFKETQRSSIIESAINIGISIFGVKFFGLIGVAIGTVAAMLYRILYLALYVSKHIIKTDFFVFLKNICVDIVIAIVGYSLCLSFNLSSITYFGWVILAIKVAITVGLVSVILNIIVNKNMIILFTKLIRTV